MTVRTNGPAIRAIRERSGYGVRLLRDQLAAEHGVEVHEDHLRNIETGARNAGPRLVKAIAEVLRVPVVALLAHPDTFRRE